MLPDQHTGALDPAFASWTDTVWTADTHIGSREGIACSCRMAVAQASAENRSSDSGKVGGLTVCGVYLNNNNSNKVNFNIGKLCLYPLRSGGIL